MLNGNDLSRAASESGSPEFFEVRLDNLQVRVRIDYSAIRDLQAGFDGLGERVGLLLGSSSPQALSIRYCEPLTLSPAILADSRSLRGALHQSIRARRRNPLMDAPELLGCFRTRDAGSFGMIDGDLEIAKNSFPGMDPLFLAIRTSQHHLWQATLSSLDGMSAKASSVPVAEFPFDEYLLRNGYVNGTLTASRSAMVPARLSPVQKNHTRWIVAALVFGIFLAGSAGTYTYERYRQLERTEGTERKEQETGALRLRVVRNGKDFEVAWDRSSAALQKASGGVLTINDGGLTRSVALDPAQLREGQILYTPLFEEITFRLEVKTPDQGATAESVQVLAWSGKQAADTMIVPSPGSAADTKTPAHAPPAADPKSPSPVPAAKLVPPSLAKPAPATAAITGKQTPAIQAPPVPHTVAVTQPSSSNSAPKQNVPLPSPASPSETSPPVVVPERPPVTQLAPESPAKEPPSQTPPASLSRVVAPAPSPAPPAPKPEPPPVGQPLPVAPAAASSTSPAPAAAAPTASANFTLPVPIKRVPPSLSRTFTTSAVERIVSVRVMVDPSGSVQNAEVTSSTPKGAFGEAVVKQAALDAARKWTFRPSQLNGKNVAAEYTIDFKFQ